MKAQLASLSMSSSSTPLETTTDTRTTTSSSKFLFNSLSPGAKKRVAARMRAEKQNLARGTMENVRNEFGINVCYWLFNHLVCLIYLFFSYLTTICHQQEQYELRKNLLMLLNSFLLMMKSHD